MIKFFNPVIKIALETLSSFHSMSDSCFSLGVPYQWHHNKTMLNKSGIITVQNRQICIISQLILEWSSIKMALYIIYNIPCWIYRTCQELQSSCRCKVFYTVRFLFDRLLLFGREISGTLLLALEAYASSRTSSPCWRIELSYRHKKTLIVLWAVWFIIASKEKTGVVIDSVGIFI